MFGRIKKQPVPAGCEEMEIETESSICSGERLVGFRDPASKKLLYAELVNGDDDVDKFCKRYGREPI
jgi:hypothetical protein